MCLKQKNKPSITRQSYVILVCTNLSTPTLLFQECCSIRQSKLLEQQRQLIKQDPLRCGKILFSTHRQAAQNLFADDLPDCPKQGIPSPGPVHPICTVESLVKQTWWSWNNLPIISLIKNTHLHSFLLHLSIGVIENHFRISLLQFIHPTNAYHEFNVRLGLLEICKFLVNLLIVTQINCAIFDWWKPNNQMRAQIQVDIRWKQLLWWIFTAWNGVITNDDPSGK